MAPWLDDEEQTAAEGDRSSDRVADLLRLTSALSCARTAGEVSATVCSIGSEILGARSSALWLAERAGRLVLASSSGLPHDLTQRYRVLDRESGSPAVAVARSGEPLWVESEDDYRRVAPRIWGDAPTGSLGSFAALPIFAESQSAGVFVVAHPPWHRYSEEERTFCLAIAQHCSQAFERARLLDIEQRARQRLSLLARAGEVLSSSVDLEETLLNVVEVAVPPLSDLCFVEVIGSTIARRVESFASEPLTREVASRITWPTTRSEPFRAEVTEAWIAARTSDPTERLAWRALGIRSLVVVPLMSRGVRLGALTLCFQGPGRVHTDESVGLAEEFAERAALAIEHALLFHAAKSAAREAEDAARRASEANRVKDEFLATVSHELRTPLNAIMGWAHLLRDKHDDASAIAGGLEVIRRNAKTQARLVDDILDVSRIIAGKLHVVATPVDLCEIVEQALDGIRPMATARHVAIEVDGLARTCTVEGDGERLQQVAFNLLSNAIKFTDDGGEVHVELSAGETHATLTVSDTGRGIEPEFLPHVFERFRQADSSTTRRFGGLGLGLAIVRHIVEAHGGRITAMSDGPGCGSAFRVELPLCERPRISEATPSAPSYFANTGERSVLECALGRAQLLDGIRVLVVDDAPDARDLVEVALIERGAAVASAGSVPEALEVFEGFRPHAVVSDIGMPEEDGYALIAQIRARPLDQGGAVKAIALTAYTRAEDRAQARASGFDDHLAKPAHPDRIAHVLRQLVDTSTGEAYS